jgi:small subunit ribosomal protein S16
MKRLGRKHRPFFRICAIDQRAPRDGRVLEELGTYDPSVRETDARAILKAERIDYWLSVGAQPSDKVAVLIKKYGSGGECVEAQQAALNRLAQPKAVPAPGKPVSKPKAAEPEKYEEPESSDEPAAESADAEPARGASAGEATQETSGGS